MHFWTRHREALDPWNPDADPDSHPTAYGHAFLELYQRMRSEGRAVTIGPRPPSRSTAVVASLEELVAHQPQIPARMMLRFAASLLGLHRRPSVIVLRVDTYLSVRAPSFTTLEAMPTRASIRLPRQRVLPLLPQRGLCPRDAARGTRLENVAIKAYSYNIPAWVDDDFEERLGDLGLTLRIDTEANGRWTDFTNLDAVLCTHAPGVDDRSKPPTKLVAAWAGGVIPVCGPFVGYLENGTDGETMVVADDDGSEGYLRALRALRERADLAEKIRAALPAAAAQYSPAGVVEENWRALVAAPPIERSKAFAALLGAAPVAALSRVRRLLRRRQG